MRSLLRRPRSGTVIAFLALLIALGGTSYAAIKLPANSVGSKQIKKNAVTGKKVKDRSLTASDFATGQLPAGAVGPTGPAGKDGAPGKDGVDGTSATTNVVMRFPTSSTTITNGNSATSFANCAAGEKATGGGYFVQGGITVNASRPYPLSDGGTATAWQVNATNNSGSSQPIGAYVICISP